MYLLAVKGNMFMAFYLMINIVFGSVCFQGSYKTIQPGKPWDFNTHPRRHPKFGRLTLKIIFCHRKSHSQLVRTLFPCVPQSVSRVLHHLLK